MSTHALSAPEGSVSKAPTSPPLKVDSTHQGEARIVKLVGELDLASTPHAEAQILAALMDTHKMIVVDLSELAFIDSAGISALLRVEAGSAADAGRLVFLRGTPPVQRVLRLCGADGQLKFLD